MLLPDFFNALVVLASHLSAVIVTVAISIALLVVPPRPAVTVAGGQTVSTPKPARAGTTMPCASAAFENARQKK